MFQIAMDIAQAKEAADQSTKELVKLPQPTAPGNFVRKQQEETAIAAERHAATGCSFKDAGIVERKDIHVSQEQTAEKASTRRLSKKRKGSL